MADSAVDDGGRRISDRPDGADDQFGDDDHFGDDNAFGDEGSFETFPPEAALSGNEDRLPSVPRRTLPYEPDSGDPVGGEPDSGRLTAMTAGNWPALAAALPLTGLAAELARQSEWLAADDRHIVLRVAARSLAESPGKARLRTVLSEHFGAALALDIECGATGEGTAYARAQARQRVRQERAEKAARTDPFVRSLLSEFGGTVVPGSVQAVPKGDGEP